MANEPSEVLPQPHEGISGIDRSDDPIVSLEPEAIAYREAIRIVAQHLYSATLVGNPAPAVERMGEWMRSPRVGDLVTEVSTAYFAADKPRGQAPENWPYTRMGYLIEVRREWADTDEQWAKLVADEAAEGWDLNEERGIEPRAWYIQYGQNPGDVCRWENCDFLAIPTDLRQFDQPLGTRDERGGVTLTRADLIGHLANSGFEINT